MLGCGAHVTMLRRTAVADYPVAEMMPINELQLLAESFPLSKLDRLLLPTDTAVSKLPALHLDAEQSKAIGFGQRVKFAKRTAIKWPSAVIFSGEFILRRGINRREYYSPTTLNYTICITSLPFL